MNTCVDVKVEVGGEESGKVEVCLGSSAVCGARGRGQKCGDPPRPPARAMASLWHLGDASTEMPFRL